MGPSFLSNKYHGASSGAWEIDLGTVPVDTNKLASVQFMNIANSAGLGEMAYLNKLSILDLEFSGRDAGAFQVMLDPTGTSYNGKAVCR